jgi:hypothetical protein
MQSVEGIQISELSLGRALAYLSAHQSGMKTNGADQMSPEESRIFKLLKERLDTLSGHSQSGISERLPNSPCVTDKPYMEDSEDVFVEMLLLAAQDDKLKEECNKIWQHLNDCYKCFNYFCKVMRGYSLTTLEFINEEKESEK